MWINFEPWNMIQTAEVTYLHVEAIWRARFATFAFLGVFARYRGQSSAGASASWLIASLARLPRRSQPSWPSSDHMASHKETQSGCGARKGHGHDRGHARRSARRHGFPRGRWAIDSPWHRRWSERPRWRTRGATRGSAFFHYSALRRSISRWPVWTISPIDEAIEN